MSFQGLHCTFEERASKGLSLRGYDVWFSETGKALLSVYGSHTLLFSLHSLRMIPKSDAGEISLRSSQSSPCQVQNSYRARQSRPGPCPLGVYRLWVETSIQQTSIVAHSKSTMKAKQSAKADTRMEEVPRKVTQDQVRMTAHYKQTFNRNAKLKTKTYSASTRPKQLFS